MNNKEEAEKNWNENMMMRVSWINERVQLTNTLGDYIYFQQHELLSDFKEALIQAVEKEKNEYGNGEYYEGYERALNDVIKLINETKPL